MKLSTGIEITQDFITPLSELKSNNRHLNGIRWNKPENFHITTYYFGDTLSIKLNEIIQKLESVTHRHPAIVLEYRRLGFSPGKNPKMFWAYFYLNPEFQKLCNEIANSTQSTMPARYKPTPHISIARLKKSHRYYQPNFDIEAPLFLKSNNLFLWESIGNKYKCIKKFDLGNTDITMQLNKS